MEKHVNNFDIARASTGGKCSPKTRDLWFALHACKSEHERELVLSGFRAAQA